MKATIFKVVVALTFLSLGEPSLSQIRGLPQLPTPGLE